MLNVFISLYISIIMVFLIHFNYNLYIIHVIQSSDYEVFFFNNRFNERFLRLKFMQIYIFQCF